MPGRGRGYRSGAQMSEYQYYEFQTVDRRLTDKEMQELRSYSTRAVITPTSFSNEYSFGDFKGNPDAWMEKYFDGFVYLANWGTHELQLALPAGLLPAETARYFCSGQAVSVRQKAGKTILTFRADEDPDGEWVEGQGILSALLPLRADLAQGDWRSMYIGWLLNVQSGEMDAGELEPPMPPNLAECSGPLSHLVEFLGLDPDLLAVAAEASPSQENRPAQPEEMAAWVAQLPAKDKDALLVRVLAGEEVVLGGELRARFRRRGGESCLKPVAPRRTAGELLATAESHRARRRREVARKAAEEKARQEARAALARRKHLDSLAGREPELWGKAEELVASKLPKNYDLAVQHLTDLRDLAAGKGAAADFSRRLARFGEVHSRKGTFLVRLQQKGLS
jgi:hypothetical protein